MGKGYLADTNSVIEYLENKLPEKILVFMDNLEMHLSVISRIELLGWSKMTEHQFQQLSGFISASLVYDLSEEIIQNTIKIRKSHRIKLPDAIIAATAITNNLTLITRNTSDFKKIVNLQVLNPWDIS
ncbi:type II toxin-antitoxin system VapC family toxin [Pedobacter sp. KBS0701]|uniref:type II toxin-antitoxin system VapC family toxin n=1 Tax=unclassified Pedobacter TaxID=2628915 RepID=UPI00110E391B|nr:type II toxin-antitoxin system VapC family toxin [Pedobacter sp. KBS0701]QDW26772.1 type II toxin-antitoxin system VapC family toxin [Pedobacter sp. KBS0701]